MTDEDRQRAEWACERLIRRFARLNDAQDHDAIAAMFMADGSFARPSDPGNPVIGRDAIRDVFAKRPRRLSRHIMANTVVDILADDEARADSVVLLFQGAAGQPPLVGDFADTFRRSPGGEWLFQTRRGSLAFPA